MWLNSSATFAPNRYPAPLGLISQASRISSGSDHIMSQNAPSCGISRLRSIVRIYSRREKGRNRQDQETKKEACSTVRLFDARAGGTSNTPTTVWNNQPCVGVGVVLVGGVQTCKHPATPCHGGFRPPRSGALTHSARHQPNTPPPPPNHRKNFRESPECVGQPPSSGECVIINFKTPRQHNSRPSSSSMSYQGPKKTKKAKTFGRTHRPHGA